MANLNVVQLILDIEKSWSLSSLPELDTTGQDEEAEINRLFSNKQFNEIDLSNNKLEELYAFSFLSPHSISYYLSTYLIYTLNILANREEYPYGCIDTPVQHLITSVLCAKKNKRKLKIINCCSKDQLDCISRFLTILQKEIDFFCCEDKLNNINKAIDDWKS